MNEDLRQLVLRCQGGDELAWEALVRRFQGRVYALSCHYLGPGEDARDLSQDVFVRIYRNLPAFEQPESFVPWMLRITRTAAIDHVRRRKARPPAQDLAAEDLPGLSDDAPDPEQSTEHQMRRRLVHRALARLSEIHREILMMKEIQGLPLIEVARILEIPLGTAKSRANRARVELAHQVLALEGAGRSPSGREDAS